MKYKRILTIQDLSCVGQCSLTVALPIVSACGVECSVLPSAVLSTHTSGFTNYTFRDLTEDLPKILKHWEDENIKFDAIYTGYIGSLKQIEYVKDILRGVDAEGGVKIVDPAMADNGKLYPGFDDAYAKAMLTLCKEADIILPNITESCMMLDLEYKTEYDEAYIEDILKKLYNETGAKVVLKGVGYTKDTTGVCVFDGQKIHYYKHKKYEKGLHGTGDVYASAFTGCLANGLTIEASAETAADFTLKSIENTYRYDDHSYGPCFEEILPQLKSMLDKRK